MALLLDPDRPFAPRRLPFFYGWWIAALGTLGILMSMPGQTMGVSIFADPLMEATGLSRLGLSNAYLVGTVASGLVLPRAGLLLDRFGARGMGIVACAGLASTLVALSNVDRGAAWLAAALPFVSVATLSAGLLCLLFFALRFTGQGLLTMVSRTMMVKWFDRRRGLVSGVSGVFVSFGFSLAPALFLAWVSASGWRGAWTEMALVVGLAMGAIVAVFYRDNPEECGLRMDGDAVEAPTDGSPSVIPEEPGYTRAEAVRTAGFWFVTLPLSIQAMIFTGVTFHIVDIGAEAGLSQQAAVAVFIPIAFLATPTGFAVGWAEDRLKRMQRLMMAMAAAQAVGFVGVSALGSPVFYAIAVLGWGLSQGFYGPVLAVGMPRLFGRAHLGAIAGAQLSCLVIGSALGPSALALSKAALGSYSAGLLWSCGLSLAAIAFTLVAPTPPAKHTA